MPGNDLTKKPGLSILQLERIVGDVSWQPVWRPEADRAADYYDDRQFTGKEMKELEDRGQPVLIHNLIKPAINGVLGLEAKTRTDWKLLATGGEEGLPVAEALGEKLNEAARITRANRAIADAYAAQVKTGLGWVEVRRQSDPFKYPYEVNHVHRNEIWWDWNSQKPDLSDARWLLRRKWLEADELIMAFPQHRELIEALSSGAFSGDGLFNTEETLLHSDYLQGAYTDHVSTAMPEDEWWDPDRRRCLVYEVWYRVWDKKPVLKLPNGSAMVYDPKNPRHHAVIAAGRAEVVIAPFSRMRLAFFIGPHRLADLESPHPHNKFPYVPFWGYREDRTRIPYGIIRSMMPAQDEINKRRSKLTWLLNAKLIVKDEDSVLEQSDEDVMDQVHNGQGIITLNPQRQNRSSDAFRIQTDMGVAQQQFQVMQEAQQMIQDVAGIYTSFLGKEGGADSGVAIDSLIEQSTTTLAEMNDNYQFGRQNVGELLLAHIVDDIGDREEDVKINVNSPQRTKVVRLNERWEDGGRTQVKNSVTKTKTSVVLADVQSTPAFRQQMARELMDMAGGLPEQFQVVLIDLIVELSDIPNRDEVLKRIRQVSGQGINPEDLSEEERAQMQRKQELQQEMEQMEIEQKRLELQELSAKARDLNARAQKEEQLTSAEREKLVAETREINAKIKKTVTDIAQARRDLAKTIDAEIELEQKRLPQSEPTRVEPNS